MPTWPLTFQTHQELPISTTEILIWAGIIMEIQALQRQVFGA